MFRVEVYSRGTDMKGESLRKSFEEDLGIKAEAVTTAEVYTITGVQGEDEANRIASELLSEPLVSTYFIGSRRHDASWVLEVAYKPGVQDPAELSAVKAIMDLGLNVESVKTSKKIIIRGVSEGYIKKIAGFIANSTIQDCIYGYGETMKEEMLQKQPLRINVEGGGIAVVDVLGSDDEALLRLSRSSLLALNLEEMRAIKAHFKKLGRNPTDAEIEAIAQTWSEHCKHKTFNAEIEYVEGDGGDGDGGKKELIRNLFKETIVAATGRIKKDWLVSVFKDNAGIIRFDENSSVAFKVETHNHPSALDPYGGAGTGIGGVIRDVLGAGLGAKPIFSTDVFCFASPYYGGQVPGRILHPKRIMKGVVAGVRDYGNRMGIPTVNGAIIFHDDFLGAPLVFCGTAGMLPKGMESKKASPGELIVAVGGRTGRDGIHGATFSSAVLDSSSPASAVQIGNAIEEKKMLDALLAARDKKLYSCITDCGAGGFSSAVGEMAENTGASVQLEKAPLKYEGLKPWEIWLSESQERMVVSVPKRNLDAFMDICKKEDTEAAVIGEFTGDKKLRVSHNGKAVVELDMDFLHSGLPKTKRKAVWRKPQLKEPGVDEKGDYADTLKQLLSHPTIASKEWVIRQYDHEVQAATVIKPLTGAANDGPSDAAVIKPLFDSYNGIVVANGINPRYSSIDTYWMAASAIDEALRNIVASGGNLQHTAILDNFCWGNVQEEEKLGSLVRAAKACHDFAILFETPFISGKDSLHNEFVIGNRKMSIPDTLLISAISVVDDVRKCITMDAKKEGNIIYIIGKTYDELGGSYYYELLGHTGANAPIVRKEARQTFEKLSSAIRKGLVRSCHDCSEGGLAVAAAEMAFAGNLGMKIDLGKVPYDGDKRADKILFSESNSRFVVEICELKEADFEKEMQGVAISRIGEITADKKLTITGLNTATVIDADISELKDCWQKTFRW